MFRAWRARKAGRAIWKVPGCDSRTYGASGAAARLLRILREAGGVLVYSTCTISPPENEACARAFLARHGEFDAVGFDACLPEPLRKRAAGGMLQLFPHLDGMEGFFLAKFTRKRAE